MAAGLEKIPGHVFSLGFTPLYGPSSQHEPTVTHGSPLKNVYLNR